MSVESWASEFFPYMDMFEVITDEESAIKHSLRKWEGLLPENLIKHEVRLVKLNIYDSWSIEDREGDELTGILKAHACALCVYNRYNCDECPLYEVQGGTECDESGSVYSRCVKNTDMEIKPRLMIEALTSLLKKE